MKFCLGKLAWRVALIVRCEFDDHGVLHVRWRRGEGKGRARMIREWCRRKLFSGQALDDGADLVPDRALLNR
jgi:hypothetical protein